MSLARRIALHIALAVVLLAGVPAGATAAPRTTVWPSDTVRISVDAERIAGATRFATGVEIARVGFPGWTGVSHVVVASGQDRSLADPLAAGGLCWAYDAPLLLVAGDSVPDVTRAALEEIVSVNTTVTVMVVGGTGAVSDGCIAELESIVGAGQVLRPFAGVDRYETAALISAHVSEVASATPALTRSDAVLIANGNGYFDALALAAVSARTGAPVLFVERDLVPDVTRTEMERLGASEVIIGGGSGVVSEATYAALAGTERWAGINRYATAAVIAEKATERGWFDTGSFGLAATIPDALVGATLSARVGMPLLFTRGDVISKESARYVEQRESDLLTCTVFGGSGVISADAFAQLEGAPSKPVFTGPLQGALTAKKARVTVYVGPNTGTCSLYAGSTLLATRAVPSYGLVDFGSVAMPATGEALRAVVGGPEGGAAESAVTIRRLVYPAATSIVIDKSDFRLYWVNGDVLIKAYPVAIGRVGMETPVATWKILAKYYTDPAGVYGPRKMRLYRQYGSSFVYTAYAIHGTNEPWVIGTKASHGCIRMYNADVLELFPQVPIGTLVQTRE